MILTVKGANCDASTDPMICSMPLNTLFTLSVDATYVPFEGYIGFQSAVDLGSLPLYIPANASADQIVWPDCDGRTATVYKSSPHIEGHGCLTGIGIPPLGFPTSSYTGNLVEIPERCTSFSSETTVRLLQNGDPNIGSNDGSQFILPGGTRVVPKVGSITIACLDTLPTYTSTATATSTATPTPTATITPVATPPSVGGISLDSHLRLLQGERSGQGAAGQVAIAVALFICLLGGGIWFGRRRLA